jgi:superfamily II DNA or RNA helicase
MITQVSATKSILTDLDFDEVNRHLQYHDKRVDFEIKKCKDSKPWFVKKYGEEAFQQKLDDLKAKRIKTLLFKNEDGTYWTYSGISKYLADKMRDQHLNQVQYPEPKAIPWSKEPDKIPRPYQKEIVEKLIEIRHGAVEVGTGLGKSFCALLLAKHFGLKTVIMTPSKNICNQMYDEFIKHFGKKYVGKYGDGKKEFSKLFVVAIDDSLSRVEVGTEAWDALSAASVFIADESHLTAAATLAKVCFGLMANSPYRYFFSGTQFRNDGLDLLLHAITGGIVFKMTVQEGVDHDPPYLAKPMFRMIKMKSRVNYYSDDQNKMTRAHLYYNNDVIKTAASVANQMVEELGRPVVILIEELEQFTKLLPYLKHKVGFAHALCSKDNMDKIPPEYRKSDPTALVEAFNRHEFPILIGTSCISIGTDIQDARALIYLQGGKSEIQVRQAIGRATRLCDGKTDCFILDFDVSECETTHRHAYARREIYQEIYPGLEEMSV